jgi:hypothetical protein
MAKFDLRIKSEIDDILLKPTIPLFHSWRKKFPAENML